MTLATLAFVDGPNASPATIEQLTLSPSWLGQVSDFTMGAPTFEAGPDSVGGEYGWRTVAFTLKLIGTYSAVATKMQTISRQLLASRNWLMVQWQTTPQPMFLRTYRTQQDAVAWQYASGNVWQLPVRLVADPWISGIREDAVASLLVTNNPAAGTRGMFFDTPVIKGDFDTAPVIWFPSNSTALADSLGETWIGAEVAPAAGSVYRTQAESGTMGTDTSSAADATFSNGSKVTVTFATVATLFPRLTNLAISSGAVPVGDYRVFAKVSVALANTSVFTFQLTVDGQATPAKAWSSFPGLSLVDLGVIPIPSGNVPPGFGLGAAPIAAAPTMSLDIGRTGYAQSLVLDYLWFVPANRTLAQVSLAGSGTSAVIDGVNDGLYCISAASPFAGGPTYVAPPAPPTIGGKLPLLAAGVVNRIHLGIGTSGIAVTRTVSLSYWPKYLHIRPDTT